MIYLMNNIKTNLSILYLIYYVYILIDCCHKLYYKSLYLFDFESIVLLNTYNSIQYYVSK